MQKLQKIVALLLACYVLQGNCQYSAEEDFDEESEESDVNQNQASSSGNNATAVAVASTNVNGTVSNTTVPTNNRVIGQVDNIITNVQRLNITGIVDQSLGIRNNTEIRKFVNGIIHTVFCNPFLANFNNCGHTKTTL